MTTFTAVAYGTAQADDVDWRPPEVGVAFTLEGFLIQPPEGLAWQPDTDRDSQIFAMVAGHFLGERYRAGLGTELRDHLAATGGYRYTSGSAERVLPTTVDLGVSLRILEWLALYLGVPLSQLPTVSLVRADQVELILLGYTVQRLFFDLKDPTTVARLGSRPLPDWYTLPLFSQVIAHYRTELLAYEAAGPEDGGAVLGPLMVKLLEPALVLDSVRADPAVAGHPVYRTMWHLKELPPDADPTLPADPAPPAGPVDAQLAGLFIGFAMTQPDLRARILAGDSTPLDNGSTPTVELMDRFVRFSIRLAPEQTRELAGQVLREGWTDRNAPPLPADLKISPALEPPFYDAATGTEHWFALDLTFSDIYDALADTFGGFAYYWS